MASGPARSRQSRRNWLMPWSASQRFGAARLTLVRRGVPSAKAAAATWVANHATHAPTRVADYNNTPRRRQQSSSSNEKEVPFDEKHPSKSPAADIITKSTAKVAIKAINKLPEGWKPAIDATSKQWYCYHRASDVKGSSFASCLLMMQAR